MHRCLDVTSVAKAVYGLPIDALQPRTLVHSMKRDKRILAHWPIIPIRSRANGYSCLDHAGLRAGGQNAVARHVDFGERATKAARLWAR